MYEFTQVVGTSLLTEEGALILGLFYMKMGKMGFVSICVAFVVGVLWGNLGVYFMGRVASRFTIPVLSPWVEKNSRLFKSETSSLGGLDHFVIMTRFVPGFRTPTYLALGYTKYSFLKFTAILFITATLYLGVALFCSSFFEIGPESPWWLYALLALGVFVLTTVVFKLMVWVGTKMGFFK